MNKKLRIIILADHNIGRSITKYLLEQKNIEILAIYTNQEKENQWWPSVKNLEKQFKFNIKYFRTNELLHSEIKDTDVDLIFVLSWAHLLSKEILKIPKIGSINLHYSLLPKHRGTYPNVWPIILGEKTTGITYHWIDEKVDHGNIIIQSKTNINAWETAKDLYIKLDELAFNTFIQFWNNQDSYLTKKNKPKGEESYHFSKDYNNLNELDLEQSIKIKDFINLLRGKSFYPEYNNLYFIDSETNKKVYIYGLFKPEE